jgi:hypothetical protein
MGYYSVIILSPKDHTRHDYIPQTVYFGEDENMMQVKFYEAVRKARQMPTAESVVVWHDLEELVKVYIDHAY